MRPTLLRILAALAVPMGALSVAFAETPTAPSASATASASPIPGGPAAPVVDILDVPGVIDPSIARYLTSEIADAERRGSSLVLLRMDSAGALKIGDDSSPAPPVARRIAAARVPVAVWVGPRGARAAGGARFVLEAADVAAASPGARIGDLHPADLGSPGRWTRLQERAALEALAATNGRRSGSLDARASGAEGLLRAIDGRVARTPAGTVVLRLPERETLVRFHKPGPIRRALHGLANPALAYLLLLGGVMLVVFELFQPGFGVAGVSGALVLAGAAYGFSVLPVRPWGLGVLLLGLALFTWDVAVHGLGVPSALGAAAVAAGSLTLGTAGALRIPGWLVALGVLSCVMFFVPIMTVAVRARRAEGD
ncbi:MAG: hypothetical protein HY775_04005 [Acidobacteria bacterium]|nr:hypothetical protein [Acidobacteriota bacterium]